MIDRLTGCIVHRSADGVVVDVGGVGFRLEMPALSLRALPGDGESVTVFTFLHVKEDGLQLYGFASEQERELFALLLTVSKVGPKLALALLSSYRPVDIVRALAAGDVRSLSAVPGLGRKTAERLVLELKDKVVAGWPVAGEAVTAMSDAHGALSTEPDSIALARAALQELGMTPAEADQALRGADAEESVTVLVRRALSRRG